MSNKQLRSIAQGNQNKEKAETDEQRPEISELSETIYSAFSNK